MLMLMFCSIKLILNILNNISLAEVLAYLLKTNRPNFKSKSLVRFTVINRIEIHQWKLSKFLCSDFKYCFRFCSLVPASVQQNVWLVVVR